MIGHPNDSALIAGFGFPAWLRTLHWINVLFIGLVMRSGVQILAALPKLYWHDDATPGTEWVKFTRKELPKDRLWISLEEEVEPPSWLAQPGGDNLGIGRHWHFFTIGGWVTCGAAYWALLFATGEWRRLIPTSWSILPGAWHTLVTYITFHIPPSSALHPYDPLQQLAYAGVVFLLAPLLILTGAAQSPAIQAAFPWFPRLFGGRQGARSIHFLGLVAFAAFILVHTVLVFVTGTRRNLGDMVLGQHRTHQTLAVGLGLGFIAVTLVIYALTTWYSLRHPRTVQRALGTIINAMRRLLLHRMVARRTLSEDKISPFFRVNGYPPETSEYKDLLARGFAGWSLSVTGLVAQPISLTLDDFRRMHKQTYVTRHNCIQGWTAVAKWGGVALADVLAMCRPLPEARYVVFRSYQNGKSGRPFYSALDIRLAFHPQTVLAYEMNDKSLPMPYGAPLRLRVETQLGFKMVKWLRSVELVHDYRTIGEGMGGSREDEMFYDILAEI